MRPSIWVLGLFLGVLTAPPTLFGSGDQLAIAKPLKEGPTPTETPKIRDCTHAVRIILSCTDDKSLKPCLLTLRLTPGEQEPFGCEPVFCDEAIVECTLDSG
ncbi:MAG: hypothetical protein HUU16_06205, partial [Candidatus Omnitrophica bacterium]|nr:hypothetical protein [Candidatus Omnitrophota bacterium]